MAWPVHNFIGGALPLLCFAFYTMSTPRWTGALSLWMTSAGSFANHLQDHSQVPSFCSWWLLDALWVGRRQLLASPTFGWGSSWPQTYSWSGWHLLNRTRWLTTRRRLQWAANCCPLTKPFLQAFWQWKSAVKSSARPNKLLRGFAHLLHCLFEKDYHHPTPYAPQSSWWGASDASASDSGEAYVGGWNQPNPEKNQVWWFHYQVKEDQRPGAFKDRKPKRRIAALEMLGTLFLTMYLCKKSSSLRGPVLLPLASDNQGNIYGLLNDYARKMPTACLLVEIMFQLTATSCSLMPSHVKRDFNQWADDLTHPSKALTPRWNLWLHRYSRSLRSSLGYFNILMPKVIFLDRNQSSLPLLFQNWRREGRVSTGFGWSYSPRTLSWERSFPLILTFPTCGLWEWDLVGLCQLLACWYGWIFGPPDRDQCGVDPEHFWSHFDTCQQARVAQTGTQTQKEKVLLLLLLGCCLSISSVGLFSWLADIFWKKEAVYLYFWFSSCFFAPYPEAQLPQMASRQECWESGSGHRGWALSSEKMRNTSLGWKIPLWMKDVCVSYWKWGIFPLPW